ncbi:MAG: dTDP-4-dehydrorhamnose 3,5-epimerase [Ruminococcaceae bacterium]|nr:dTDP-4-dehydrorhamnose 3,5-epimerase [Oscillospiraceae bacterium]
MSKFTFEKTPIEGLFVITPTVFGDHRGYFMETYQKEEFASAGIDVDFVQDNESCSSRGVLRGMHFQKKNPQGKLVRVLEGEVFDVAVDLRPGSSTYGKWHGVTLSAENKKQFYVPEGFAHGFLVLSERATFVYKCTRFYCPNDEGGLAYDDPAVGIEWPITPDMELKLSDKDTKHPTLAEL